MISTPETVISLRDLVIRNIETPDFSNGISKAQIEEFSSRVSEAFGTYIRPGAGYYTVARMLIDWEQDPNFQNTHHFVDCKFPAAALALWCEQTNVNWFYYFPLTGLHPNIYIQTNTGKWTRTSFIGAAITEDANELMTAHVDEGGNITASFGNRPMDVWTNVETAIRINDIQQAQRLLSKGKKDDGKARALLIEELAGQIGIISPQSQERQVYWLDAANIVREKGSLYVD